MAINKMSNLLGGSSQEPYPSTEELFNEYHSNMPEHLTETFEDFENKKRAEIYDRNAQFETPGEIARYTENLPNNEEQPAMKEPSNADIAGILQRASSKRQVQSPVNNLQSSSIPEIPSQPKELDYLKRFKEAQDQANKQTGMANVLDSSQGFLKAGLMYGGQISPDEASKVITNEGYDKIRAQAAKAPDEVTAQMRVESAAKKLQDEKDKADPKSAISKIYEKQAVRLGLPPGYSAAQYEAVLGNQLKIREGEENRAMRLQLAQQAADQRKQALEEKNRMLTEEGKRKRDQFVTGRAQAWQDTTNKALEKMDEQINKLGNINNISDLATKNPMAAAQLGVQVAKAMGEMGALSEADVTRYVQNKALVPRIKQNISMMMSGTILPENAEALKESLTTLQKMTEDRKNLVIRKRAAQFARNMSSNIDLPTSTNDALLYLGQDEYVSDNPIDDAPQTLDTARSQLKQNQSKSEGKQPSSAKISPATAEARINAAMKQNPKASRQQVENALKSKGLI